MNIQSYAFFMEYLKRREFGIRITPSADEEKTNKNR